jgi:hypothetical protein
MDQPLALEQFLEAHAEARERKQGIETRSTAHSLWRTVRPGSADRPRWAARTVQPAIADCPREHRGPSGQRRGPSVKSHRNNRGDPRTTDRSRGARGLSARHPRTVRQAPADRPPSAANRPKLRPTENQNRDGSKRKASKITKNTGRTLAARTVRQVLADRPPGADRAENARSRKSTPPNHHRISQTVEAMETRVWGLEKGHTRML